MDRMTRRCKSVHNFAIISTVALCLSAVGLVLGAIFDLIPLLFASIALTILSLIVTAALWFLYSEIAFVCSIIDCIEDEKIFDTRKIARHLETNTKSVGEAITYAVKRGCISNYTLVGNEIIEITPKVEVACKNCYAKVFVSKDYPKCPYCGRVFDLEVEAKKASSEESHKKSDT